VAAVPVVLLVLAYLAACMVVVVDQAQADAAQAVGRWRLPTILA
jgi:hypothetical protein